MCVETKINGHGFVVSARRYGEIIETESVLLLLASITTTLEYVLILFILASIHIKYVQFVKICSEERF